MLGGAGFQPVRWEPPRGSVTAHRPHGRVIAPGDSSSPGRTSVWEAEVGEGMTSLISFLARPSHKSPAAAANMPHPAAFSQSEVLDVLRVHAAPLQSRTPLDTAS